MAEQTADKKFWRYTPEEIAAHFGSDLKKA